MQGVVQLFCAESLARVHWNQGMHCFQEFSVITKRRRLALNADEDVQERFLSLSVHGRYGSLPWRRCLADLQTWGGDVVDSQT